VITELGGPVSGFTHDLISDLFSAKNAGVTPFPECIWHSGKQASPVVTDPAARCPVQHLASRVARDPPPRRPPLGGGGDAWAGGAAVAVPPPPAGNE
jgi:hypothetical protein